MNEQHVRQSNGALPLLLVLGAALILQPVDLFGASYQTLSKSTDILQSWTPSVNLYVQGDLGLGANELEQIGSRLREKYPNWTVLLAGNAEAERFTDSGGEGHFGFDAVEWCMGTGLMNLAPFQAGKDPASGLPNRNTFLMCFNPGQVRGGPSELHRRYGVTRERWASEFFLIARDRWRNGRRIAAAVEDSIAHVEKVVADAVAAEKARGEQQIRDTQAKVTTAEETLLFLNGRVKAFRTSYPGLTGSLARPDLSALEAKLQNAKQALGPFAPTGAERPATALPNPAVDQAARTTLGQAESFADSVINGCNLLVAAMDNYPAGKGNIDALAAKLNKLGEDEYASAAERSFKSAEEQLKTARMLWERGDDQYLPALADLGKAVESIESSERSARTRAVAIRTTKRTVLTLLILGILVVGAALNLRRRPAKARAENLLATWENALAQKGEALLELDARKRTAFGDLRSQLNLRGESRKLAEQVIENIGHLLIMHVSALAVLNRARALIRPKRPLQILENFFLPQSYDQAVELLKDDPVKFDPESELKFVIEGRERTPEEALWADITEFEPFSLSFKQLMDQFNSRAEAAATVLKQIESALLNAASKLTGVETAIDSLQRVFEELAAASGGDARLQLPSGSTKLIPALDSSCEEAKRAVAFDPVMSFEISQRLEQQTSSAAQLAGGIQQAFKQVLPVLLKAAEELTQSGVSGEWLKLEFVKLLKQTDAELLKVTERESSFSVADQVLRLVGLANRALELNNERRGDTTSKVKTSRSALQESRTGIAGRLQLDPTLVLAEQGRNPEELLNQADKSLELAAATLSSGNLAGCEGALQEIAAKLEQAAKIVEATVKAFGDYEEVSEGIVSCGAEFKVGLSRHEQVLTKLTSTYAESALKLGAGDKSHPRVNEIVSDNIAEIQKAAETRDGLVKQAAELYTRGAILEASDLLQKAAVANDFIRHRLEEIVEKAARLDAAVKENLRSVGELDQIESELVRLGEDRRTTQKTLQLLDAARRTLAQAKAEKSGLPDPFATQALFSKAADELRGVRGQIQSDRNRFAEAVRSIGAARNAVTQLEKTLKAAREDQIPDSEGIRREDDVLKEMKRTLDGLQRTADHDDHADWYEVDAGADRVFERANSDLAKLRGEIQAGNNAAEAIGHAAKQVKLALDWTGEYGVTINGSPGSTALAAARRCLTGGRYSEALQHAKRALQEAAAAIDEAEAEVSRKRREAERRRAAERAAREAREEELRSYSRSSSHSTTISFPSFNSGMGGGSLSSSNSGMGGGSL